MQRQSEGERKSRGAEMFAHTHTYTYTHTRTQMFARLHALTAFPTL